MKEDDKKSKFIDNMAKLFVHITSDTFEQASRRAVLICFALKYAVGIGIYIALRNFISPVYGEAWMAFVFAYALYGQELYINTKVKEGLVKSILEKEDYDVEENDTENTNDIEDSEEEKKS